MLSSMIFSISILVGAEPTIAWTVPVRSVHISEASEGLIYRFSESSAGNAIGPRDIGLFVNSTGVIKWVGVPVMDRHGIQGGQMHILYKLEGSNENDLSHIDAPDIELKKRFYARSEFPPRSYEREFNGEFCVNPILPGKTVGADPRRVLESISLEEALKRLQSGSTGRMNSLFLEKLGLPSDKIKKPDQNIAVSEVDSLKESMVRVLERIECLTAEVCELKAQNQKLMAVIGLSRGDQKPGSKGANSTSKTPAEAADLLREQESK